MSVKSVLNVITFVPRWIGKGIAEVTEWVPKIVNVIRDSADGAAKLEPRLVATFQTVESLAKLAVDDGKELLPSLKTLLTDLKALGSGGMIDPTKYLDLVTAVNTFVGNVHHLDVAAFVDKVDDLIAEYDDLGVEVKSTLDKLASDLKADSGKLPQVYQTGIAPGDVRV
jgi:hypothetical protein